MPQPELCPIPRKVDRPGELIPIEIAVGLRPTPTPGRSWRRRRDGPRARSSNAGPMSGAASGQISPMRTANGPASPVAGESIVTSPTELRFRSAEGRVVRRHGPVSKSASARRILDDGHGRPVQPVPLWDSARPAISLCSASGAPREVENGPAKDRRAGDRGGWPATCLRPGGAWPEDGPTPTAVGTRPGRRHGTS